MITVIAIGKKHEDWVRDGIERYQKRCKQPWSFEWILLPHSSRNGDSAREEESERILARLKDTDYVILLDEHGAMIASPELSSRLDSLFSHGKNPVLIIGGAYGVNQKLMHRADLIWSLSPLVFPHQLVRLILAEQLYRSQEIALGHPYHHV